MPLLSLCPKQDIAIKTIIVTVKKDFVLKVHNVVTPNGDGDNDTWIIDNIEAYPDAVVAIFNRYGNKIIEENNYKNTLDGKYNNSDLPDGAYYYVITLEGSDKVYKGAINLLRSTVE